MINWRNKCILQRMRLGWRAFVEGSLRAAHGRSGRLSPCVASGLSEAGERATEVCPWKSSVGVMSRLPLQRLPSSDLQVLCGEGITEARTGKENVPENAGL